MPTLQSIHHIAIICSDYLVSKKFYTEARGFPVTAEHFRTERNSWKLDLNLNGRYAIDPDGLPFELYET